MAWSYVVFRPCCRSLGPGRHMSRAGKVIWASCGIILCSAILLTPGLLSFGRRPVLAVSEDESGANVVRFCENNLCVGRVGVLARVVGERETAMAGLMLSSAQGLLSDEERADLEAVLEEGYDRLDADQRFSGKPNALLVQSDGDKVRYLRWVPGEGTWPCIVFLHGFGGMLTPYFRALVDSELGRKTILLAPILDNDGAWWEEKGILVLRKLVQDHLPPGADPAQVYLMGLSNGAVGATVCAAVLPSLVCGLCERDMVVWPLQPWVVGSWGFSCNATQGPDVHPTHPRSAGGLEAGVRVLVDEALGRLNVEKPGRFEEDLRLGFARGNVLSADHRVEPTIHPDTSQNLLTELPGAAGGNSYRDAATGHLRNLEDFRNRAHRGKMSRVAEIFLAGHLRHVHDNPLFPGEHEHYHLGGVATHCPETFLRKRDAVGGQGLLP